MAKVIQGQFQKLEIHEANSPTCFPRQTLFDAYRIHIANALSEVTAVQPHIIYPLLLRTSTLEKGDLLLPVPALRIKGERPDVLATRWAEQVIRLLCQSL